MSLISNKNKKITIRTCRICLDSKGIDMVFLSEQNEWLQLYEYCFGFKLPNQDEHRLICRLCADNVKKYANFKQLCQKSNLLWKTVTSEVKCHITKVDVIKIEKTEGSEDNVKVIDELFDDSEFLENDVPDFQTTEIETDIFDKDTKPISFEEENLIIDKKVSLKSNEEDSDKIEIVNSNKNKTKQEKIYTCKKCKKKYERVSWYNIHKKVCKTTKPVNKRKIDSYVYNCGRNYNTENMAKNELEIKKEITTEINIQESQDGSLVICGLCKLSFNSTEELCKHLNEHWSNNELACNLCNFIGIDLAAIATHRFYHCPRDKMYYLCHICQKYHLSLLALQFHYRMVHLNKPGGVCSRCNLEFTKFVTWKKHERKHHFVPKFICDICGKKFNWKYEIKSHMSSHEEHRQSQNICHICGHCFSRSSYLKVHLQTVHTKKGSFKCTHCNKLFKGEYNFNQHQKYIAKEKTIKCELCPREFALPNDLKRHMVMHSDKRPYCCDICGASYKAKLHWKVHMRKHTGDMPFKCSLCLKEFPTSSQLKRHSAVHTGIRQHSCPHCIRTFYSKKLMLAHCASRHKNEMNHDGDKQDEEIVSRKLTTSSK